MENFMLSKDTISRTTSYPSSSSSANIDTVPDSMDVGKNSLKVYAPPAATQIGLMELPPELILGIMKMLHDNPTGIINLSSTCRCARENYLEYYKEVDRQYTLLLHNSAPLLCKLDDLYVQHGYITLPLPHTAEWRGLKNYRGNDLTLLKEAYITSWDLLLMPEFFKDQVRVCTLMQRLYKLSRSFYNRVQYAEELFAHSFPTELFIQLANIHLEYCIQLATMHFDLKEVRNFINAELPLDQEDPDDAGIKAFLFYVVNGFTSKHEESSEDENESPDYDDGYCEDKYAYRDDYNYGNNSEDDTENEDKKDTLVMEILRKGNFNINAISSDGHTALDYAISYQNDKHILALMGHSRFSLQSRGIIKHAVDNGYKFGSPIFQALLKCFENIKSYPPTSEFDGIWLTEENMIKDLCQIEDLSQFQYFITGALEFASSKGYQEAERIFKDYER
jgi:hypothetical protein